MLNVADARYDRWIRRDSRAYPPAFRLDDGTAVYEVWFWHSILRRWFVMSHYSDAAMIKQGVVYFRPDNGLVGLKSIMRALEKSAGVERAW